jgi:hypothetical protein
MTVIPEVEAAVLVGSLKLSLGRWTKMAEN